MYSMKYGTIPVVRSTGGLDDTVTAWDGTEGTGNGFKFDDLTPEAVAIVLAGVLDAYGDRRAWRRLQRNAMAFNYSWDDAVREYEEVYRRALDGVGAARTDGRQNT
jgi:starch synthase